MNTAGDVQFKSRQVKSTTASFESTFDRLPVISIGFPYYKVVCSLLFM